MLLISSNTLQQVKKLKELEVAFTSDGGWKKEIDTWIVLASAVLCQLYHSVFTKWELSNAKKLSVFRMVFVLILT